MASSPSSSAFVAAMDELTRREDEYCRGENGSLELTATGVQDALVALFFKLTRGVTDEILDELVGAALREADGKPDALADLIVLAFQTRATRGAGKGEKDCTYALLKRLDQDAVIATLKLLPLYGYWKDLLLLIERGANEAIAAEALSIFCSQLAADDAELTAAKSEDRKPKLSLASKWAPREGSSMDRKLCLARRMAVDMFGEANVAASRRKYRQLLSRCNRALGTTEVLMAANNWAEIQFARVPSLCLHRHRKAFLNEHLKVPVPAFMIETGNRHPENEARVAARKALRKSMLEGKLQGKQLQPHEIVRELLKVGSAPSVIELDLLDAQWESMKAGVKQALADAAAGQDAKVAEAAEAQGALANMDELRSALPRGIELGKLVPLVDVSGSMMGLPILAAVGLGLLTAELAAPAFCNRILTFESKPSWVDLSDCNSIFEKVQKTVKAPWGGSTNLEAACERILEVAASHRLKPDELPDLIVFSDMQFDQSMDASRRHEGQPFWETHLRRLRRRFEQAGRFVCGEPYAAPRIIFWNLRGDTYGFPAVAQEPNVQMLSGFSPALLKLILTGADLVGEEEEVEEILPDGSIVMRVVRQGPTPAQTVRAALDDDAFDAVRLALSAVSKGALAGYRFEKDGFEMVEA